VDNIIEKLREVVGGEEVELVGAGTEQVSYTHMTLPTILLV
jgi:hypothetical protein